MINPQFQNYLTDFKNNGAMTFEMDNLKGNQSIKNHKIVKETNSNIYFDDEIQSSLNLYSRKESNILNETTQIPKNNASKKIKKKDVGEVNKANSNKSKISKKISEVRSLGLQSKKISKNLKLRRRSEESYGSVVKQLIRMINFFQNDNPDFFQIICKNPFSNLLKSNFCSKIIIVFILKI